MFYAFLLNIYRTKIMFFIKSFYGMQFLKVTWVQLPLELVRFACKEITPNQQLS